MQATNWRVVADVSTIDRNNLTSECSELRTVEIDMGSALLEYRPSRWIMTTALLITAENDAVTHVRASGRYYTVEGRLGKLAEPAVDPTIPQVQEILESLRLAA